jgi:hypothetical protein
MRTTIELAKKCERAARAGDERWHGCDCGRCTTVLENREPSQFDRDTASLGWRAAMGLWLENRTTAPRIIGWVEPARRPDDSS